jgi:hypothetical protein
MRFPAATLFLLLTFGLELFADQLSLDPATNAAAGRIRSEIYSHIPFSNAVLLTTISGSSLPKHDSWKMSVEDIKYPVDLIIDLAKHKTAAYSYLWNNLSEVTRSNILMQHARLITPPGGAYKPGPELLGMVRDINKLIEGKCIYGTNLFKGCHLSGDTMQLLAGQTSGPELIRLNRLLLEDAFQLDIKPRPKILAAPSGEKYVYVDFIGKRISLYDSNGGLDWVADLNQKMNDAYQVFRLGYRVPCTPASVRNVGIWDVTFRSDRLVVKLIGASTIGIDLKTGLISDEAHF